MDQSETLGIVGVPRGLPLARSSVPKNHLIKRNRNSTLKNTFPWNETTENTQIEAVSEGLLDQDHQAKRHKVLIRDIQQESLKETPSNLPHEKSKKRLRKSSKRKKGGTQSSLGEPRRIINKYNERFIQGLASAQSSFPLTRSHHQALKLVL
jgi:hypothetical protein